MSFIQGPDTEISIHALREEGDKLEPQKGGARYISIHALREEGDQHGIAIRCGGIQFLSTPSARRATAEPPQAASSCMISIHALREEGDGDACHRAIISILFLSTPSARRATWSKPARIKLRSDFYPRPPRGGRLVQHPGGLQQLSISIHALREEGDGLARRRKHDPKDFYPRPPRGGRPP